MKMLSTRRLLTAVTVLVAAAAVTTGIQVLGGSNDASAAVGRPGLGQLSGILPRNHLTEESAIRLRLAKGDPVCALVKASSVILGVDA